MGIVEAGSNDMSPTVVRRYQRIAWVVLTMAGLAFLLLLWAAGAAAQYFWQEPREQDTARLQLAGPGSKLEVRPPGQRTWLTFSPDLALQEGYSVRTGDDTEALITLFDKSTVRIYYGTTLTLTRMRHSRADRRVKYIRLDQEAGSTRMATSALAPYAEGKFIIGDGAGRVEVSLPASSVARIDSHDPASGYLLTVTPAVGKSLVRTNGPFREVPLTMMYRVPAGTLPGTPEPARIPLLANGDFAQKSTETEGVEVAAGWRLQVSPPGPSDVPALAEVVTSTLSQPSRFVRFTRERTADGAWPAEPVEIRITQDFAPPGLPVSQYDQLEFAAKVQIAGETFVRRGIYPLTLRVTYDDINGIERLWQRDFYAPAPPEFPLVPPAPETVALQGPLWWAPPDRNGQERAWGELAGGEAPPARLKRVEAIVTGYTFDVSVTDLALIGR